MRSWTPENEAMDPRKILAHLKSFGRGLARVKFVKHIHYSIYILFSLAVLLQLPPEALRTHFPGEFSIMK